MQLILIFIVIAGGMGLSIEAGLLGPLGGEVGAQPAWQLLGGVLGPIYVIILTVVTPAIGIAMTMIGILAGQVFKSLIIDHFGLLGTSRRKIDSKRIIALIFIIAALVMVAQG